ncbi:MAG TPA: hypothetical protein VHE35_04395 [Kofleriaceae bacterium]|nr:hypothetical protein [Kofleriaceae bacterium]
MWNTGCKNIANGLGRAINVLDGEDNHWAVTVGSAGGVPFDDVIFPWCNNSNEIASKACRVSATDSGKVFMYVFQDYGVNQLCWSLSGGGDLWTNRRQVTNGRHSNHAQSPLPEVDLYIAGDRVFAVPATSPDNFKKYYADILEIVSAVGEIAAAIAAVAA